MRFVKLGLLLVLALGLLAACATQPVHHDVTLPGFLAGLVHGFISPFALVAEIFTDFRIYAYPNSGGWYDFGFMLGAGAILGGSGSQAR